MDPYRSAENFFIASEDVDGGESMTPSEAAHEVQRNADPDHFTSYVPFVEAVRDLVDTDGTACSGGQPSAPGAGPSGAPVSAERKRDLERRPGAVTVPDLAAELAGVLTDDRETEATALAPTAIGRDGEEALEDEPFESGRYARSGVVDDDALVGLPDPDPDLGVERDRWSAVAIASTSGSAAARSPPAPMRRDDRSDACRVRTVPSDARHAHARSVCANRPRSRR